MTWFNDVSQITASTIKLNLLTLGPETWCVRKVCPGSLDSRSYHGSTPFLMKGHFPRTATSRRTQETDIKFQCPAIGSARQWMPRTWTVCNKPGKFYVRFKQRIQVSIPCIVFQSSFNLYSRKTCSTFFSQYIFGPCMFNMYLSAHVYHTRSSASFHPFTEHSPAELRANPKQIQHWWQTQDSGLRSPASNSGSSLYSIPLPPKSMPSLPRTPLGSAFASWAHSSLQAHISLGSVPQISENKVTR